ncbi:MAG: guanylate kinase [Holophaga sp.]|nr:guanylate kinase [Holophaga sp.]
MFVLSAPSGTGKSTLARQLVEKVAGLDFSVSFTTRQPRPGEVDGKDYFFVDDAAFDAMVAQEGFVEWVQVYQRRYGTGKAWLQEKLEAGADILLDIETQGAQQVRRAIPGAVMVFLLPPSARELATRLRGRGDESDEQVRIRLDYARHELAEFKGYDYLVVNDTVEQAYQRLESIIIATRCRRERMGPTAQQILDSF